MITATFSRADHTATALGITAKAPRNGSCAFALCRALVAADVQDDRIMFYDLAGVACYSIPSFHRGAKWEIGENDKRGPHFLKYQERTQWWKPAEAGEA